MYRRNAHHVQQTGNPGTRDGPTTQGVTPRHHDPDEGVLVINVVGHDVPALADDVLGKVAAASGHGPCRQFDDPRAQVGPDTRHE